MYSGMFPSLPHDLVISLNSKVLESGSANNPSSESIRLMIFTFSALHDLSITTWKQSSAHLEFSDAAFIGNEVSSFALMETPGRSFVDRLQGANSV